MNTNYVGLKNFKLNKAGWQVRSFPEWLFYSSGKTGKKKKKKKNTVHKLYNKSILMIKRDIDYL